MVNVAEGVPTTRSVHDQARQRGVEMPITDEVYQILFEGKSPRDAVTDLMLRAPKDEWLTDDAGPGDGARLARNLRRSPSRNGPASATPWPRAASR